MGLIRKSFAVGTLGVVNGSSKKQRVAKATMRSAEAAAAAAREANRIAERQAAEERDFRYATDPVYRTYIDDKRAAAKAEQQAALDRAAQAARLKRERRKQRWESAKGTIRRPSARVRVGASNGSAYAEHAQSAFEGGDDNAAIKAIDVGRKRALKARDVDALQALLATAQTLRLHGAGARQGEIRRLEYALTQNIAQVKRVLAPR